MHKVKLYFDSFLSPIGKMILAATDEGICSAAFTENENFEIDPKLSLRFEIVLKGNKITEIAIQQLLEYFNHERDTFDLPLFFIGTEFQKKVWNTLLTVPYGETISYSDQALLLNDPKVIRASASANGKNKIAIIVPCHRIIGKNGSLTGYAGGLWRKKWLLEHELQKP